MSVALNPPGYLGVIWLIVAREAWAKLLSPWFYVVASVVCLIAWAYGAGFQQTFVTESVLITTDPLMAMNIAVVVFLSFVLGLRLAASMAWEREHRTLEILLIGPAGWGAIIAAKFAVELIVMVLLIAIYSIYLLVAQPLGQGVIGPKEIESLAAIPVFGLPMLALGLLVGAVSQSVRGVVLVFLVLVVLLAGFELALGILNSIGADQLSLFLLYLRAALETAAPILRPISAAAQLAHPVQSLFVQAPITPAEIGWSLILTVATLAFAIFAGRLRGVA